MKTERVATDGTRLMTHTWNPSGSPRSVIVIVHGLAKHGGRYEHVAALLTDVVMPCAPQTFAVSASRLVPRAFVKSWDDFSTISRLISSPLVGPGFPVVGARPLNGWAGCPLLRPQ